MSELRTNITKFLLIVFLVVCVFFPADPFHVKLIAFFLMSFMNIEKLIGKLKTNQYFLFYGVIFPLLLIMQSFFVSHDLGGSISGGYPATLILILLIVELYDIRYDKYLLVIIACSAVFTVILALLDILGILDVNSSSFIRDAFYDYGIGLMGKSESYSFYYKIFLKSSPLIILVINQSIKDKHKLIFIICVIAMIVSGTRANVFITLAFVLYIVTLNYDYKKIKKEKILITLAVSLLLLVLAPHIQKNISNAMSTIGAKASDEVRNGQIKSFLEIYSDPFNLFWGTGLGSSFYNYGTNSYTQSAELSYFELIRQIGLPLFIVFMIFVTTPFRFKVEKNYKVAYLCYLIIAFTNPLLFSSTAYLLYIYIYYKGANTYNLINRDKRELAKR